jgi:5-methylcytosine-specific restriction protein A
VALGAKFICRRAGCGALLDSPGYCPQHTNSQRRAADAERKTSSERGYGYRWQKARHTYLKNNPLCVGCEKLGMVRAATEVDHIIPHRGDQALFWDTSNWQGLCKPCHSRKTAREDGGWGRSAPAAPPV